MKLAIVVQRYGAEISGGAELHARFIAEHLSRHVEVEVLTTSARDYITWHNELPAGRDSVNGIPVLRFPVRRERNIFEFARRSATVFEQTHSIADELAWLESEGPASSDLLRHIDQARTTYDYFLFFSYRYHQAYFGIRAVAPRAILVPTAERDAAIGLAIFGPIFRGVRALMYNSFEERALINNVSENHDVPGVVVGVGSDMPDRTNPVRFRQKFGLHTPFSVYVGRIDENKGCKELFEFFQRYANSMRSRMTLVLVGSSILDVPAHPRIRHLGFVTDEDKFDAIAAAELLVIPSYLESLSMVTLESWALGRPVLANGRCDVLKGQCIRSNGGLYYENYEEFAEALYTLERNRPLADALGRNGRRYFQHNYAWPVIERKYLNTIDRLKEEDATRPARRGVEAIPGWWGRRRRTLPASARVVAELPAGPVRADGEPGGLNAGRRSVV